MLDGLDEVGWSSMEHAYGSADEVPALLRALRSPDADERGKALDRFYGAVHHQGDVYPCTTASLPFLLELAGDAATPGRGGIVRLLVSIGSTAVERCGEWYPPDSVDYAGAARVLRERAGQFAVLASDADPEVRRAATAGLGLFIDDAGRAAALLRGRLAAEPCPAERLAVAEAMATLALRLPAARDEAMAWFSMLAADSDAGPETRLAGVVHRARCAPEQVGDDVTATAVGLLRQVAHGAVPDGAAWDSLILAVESAPAEGAPSPVADVFADLERHRRSHALTTRLLREFHDALGARVPGRTALLSEQLGSLHPGVRTDALRMSAELMKSWRGDHTALIMLVAGQLGASSNEVAAEAAAVLGACHPIAGPAAGALARQVAAHGPDAWTASQPQLRRAYQESVAALALLGDGRAVPRLLAAFDSGTDAGRAVRPAGALPQASRELAPRVAGYLSHLDLTGPWTQMTANPALFSLAALGGPVALAAVTETLRTALRREQQSVARTALDALGRFGPAAAPALDAVRPLSASPDAWLRPAAVTALWSIGRDRDEVLPLAEDLLYGDSISSHITNAAGILGEIGAPAARALPRLRELLGHSNEWVQVHAATALWDISGDADTPVVLDTLLHAWTRNPATANHAVACLNRMGPAAVPALPHLRAQLALPRRSGRYASIDTDEELQRVSRTIVSRLS